MSNFLDLGRWRYMPVASYKFDPSIEGIPTSTWKCETTSLKKALCYGLRQAIELSRTGVSNFREYRRTRGRTGRQLAVARSVAA